MANFWGKPATVESLSRLLRDPRFPGALSSDIPRMAQQLGLHATLVPGSVGRVKKAVDRDVPPLIMVEAGGGSFHYFVVSGYNDAEGHVVCEDYGGAKRLIGYEEVEARWDGAGHFMVEIEPTSADKDFRAGAGLEARGKYAEAAALFRRALDAQADHYEARVGLGNCLLYTGKLEDALVEYKRAHEAGGSDPKVLNNLANVYLELKRETAEAERLAERAVDRLREDYQRAREEAERETQPALRELKHKGLRGQQRDLAYALGTLGQARAANGKHALAIAAWKGSYDHFPLTDFDARARRLYEMALSSRAMDMPAEARRHLERALAEARDPSLRAKIQGELR